MAYLSLRRAQKSVFCFFYTASRIKPDDHWSCIAHLSVVDMLKSAVIEEKEVKNIESE